MCNIYMALNSHFRYDVLSPGEMQRLGFLRLFFHKPMFASEFSLNIVMVMFIKKLAKKKK